MWLPLHGRCATCSVAADRRHCFFKDPNVDDAAWRSKVKYQDRVKTFDCPDCRKIRCARARLAQPNLQHGVDRQGILLAETFVKHDHVCMLCWQCKLAENSAGWIACTPFAASEPKPLSCLVPGVHLQVLPRLWRRDRQQRPRHARCRDAGGVPIWCQQHLFIRHTVHWHGACCQDRIYRPGGWHLRLHLHPCGPGEWLF